MFDGVDGECKAAAASCSIWFLRVKLAERNSSLFPRASPFSSIKQLSAIWLVVAVVVHVIELEFLGILFFVLLIWRQAASIVGAKLGLLIVKLYAQGACWRGIRPVRTAQLYMR